jgi:hypothetical protein
LNEEGKVAGSWRKLHNEELHNLYFSPSVIRMIKWTRMRWEGHVACTGEMRNAYGILVGKSEGKRPLGRPRHSWVDNVKMDLREIGWGGMNWIDLAQDREHGNEISGSINCWEILEYLHNWQLLKEDSLHGVSYV